MIEIKQGDILRADAEALVNTVNCVGVMGRGIALQFKKAFPENFKAYKTAADHNELRPGKMSVYDLCRLLNPRYIVNFPTKRHWKGKSRIEDIESGLKTLVQEVHRLGIHSIAVPPLGCGLGGLEWNEVRLRIEQAFEDAPDVSVFLFEPKGAPSATKMVKKEALPRMTVGRASLLGLMHQYLAGVMDPFVSLLEIHKLMYFMQESGEGLKLRYEKGVYGPYAQNLRHVLSEIEGHYISGYGDAEDQPDKQIELRPEAVSQAEAFLQDHPDTRNRFGRVADLIEGFETPFGLELLSTVHWVTSHDEKASSLDEAVSQTYAWNERKGMFNKAHLSVAWKVLEEKGWLSA